ncbi:MAG: response regulator transcription factor [Saprospiraceae bacterium]|nr:response regulator transcription factor [Saprospiraceae bacterium]
MKGIDELAKEYHGLLHYQVFNEEDLDYEWFEMQKPFLEELSKIDHSAITVFDMHQRKHVFASETFSSMFKIPQQVAISSTSIDPFVHPQDRIILMELGIRALRFQFKLSGEALMNYKVINEYRLQIPKGDCIRVIEQHKAFKTDRSGKVWLALSMVDLSPNQSIHQSVLNQVINTQTGETFSWLQEEQDLSKLTKREVEVLSLVGQGLISKEISDLLNISIHTVNTHRQRILEKMNANNTIEAIETAKRFGLS